MSDNANAPKQFNPADHIEYIGSGSDAKPYLNPRKATTWFYFDNPPPMGKIITNIFNLDPLIMRAEVWIKGELVATGHANSDGKSNTLKRMESAAIRRALANAGYGTDQVVGRIAKEIGVERSKEILGSGKNKAERRMGNDLADTRNPIAQLAAGLEINGTRLELAATVLGVKDLNDIAEWRSHGKTAKEIAEKVKGVQHANPFGSKPADPSQQLFDSMNDVSEAAQHHLQGA